MLDNPSSSPGDTDMRRPNFTTEQSHLIESIIAAFKTAKIGYTPRRDDFRPQTDDGLSLNVLLLNFIGPEDGDHRSVLQIFLDVLRDGNVPATCRVSEADQDILIIVST